MSHIILIDDDEAFRETLRQGLAKEYRVTVAANARSGLAVHARDPAAVIVTDIFMPEKDGFELLNELREKNSLVKVVAMSGGGTFKGCDNLKVAGRLGATCTLQKPFMVEDLLAVLRLLL